ncbi:hypothetical protein VNO77_35640 [Canavalia gladiata]|uniref:Uncharacterized protein n=1 Tax=Canavalia gladiata TaxID=3824 RepID=A0AAN9K8P1_CANGL
MWHVPSHLARFEELFIITILFIIISALALSLIISNSKYTLCLQNPPFCTSNNAMIERDRWHCRPSSWKFIVLPQSLRPYAASIIKTNNATLTQISGSKSTKSAYSTLTISDLHFHYKKGGAEADKISVYLLARLQHVQFAARINIGWSASSSTDFCSMLRLSMSPEAVPSWNLIKQICADAVHQRIIIVITFVGQSGN